ncbi:metallophosphoesterase family protein [Vibrio splendidus]|nr:metallophosphoesterase [Vibrio splendidus]MCC4883116.1 metallophosphoesterase [Vibrio splendidus]
MRIIELSKQPFYEMAYRSSGSGRATKINTLPFYFAYVDALPGGVTSIVASSDLQGREISEADNRLMGIAVAEELALMQELEMIPYIDMVLLAGDLYDSPEVNKLGATGDVTVVLNAFAKHFPVVIGVHGNHDKVQSSLLSSNITILDGQSTREQGIKIGGACGIVGREDKNQRKSEDKYLKLLTDALRQSNEVVMVHQSPQGAEPHQIGEHAMSQVLSKYGKTLLISGHVHWDSPLCEIGNNQILNADGKVYVFIERNDLTRD